MFEHVKIGDFCNFFGQLSIDTKPTFTTSTIHHYLLKHRLSSSSFSHGCDPKFSSPQIREKLYFKTHFLVQFYVLIPNLKSISLFEKVFWYHLGVVLMPVLLVGYSVVHANWGV